MKTASAQVPEISNVSVVIPTYNRPNLALKAAEVIRRFHPQIEIIIVDQKNTSFSDPKKKEKLNIKLINIDSVNISKARNAGIKEARGEIIFFFDDDVEITKNTIPAQLSAYIDKEIVGTGGRVINDGETIPKNTKVVTGVTDRLGRKFTSQFWSTKEQLIDFPYGCNMSFRKNALEKVGGFDESYPKIFDDVDLGWRIKQYGKIKFIPQALVYHHKAKTGGIRADEQKDKQKFIFYYYGLYLGKSICFPFSLYTLLTRTITALKTKPILSGDLYQGYIKGLMSRITTHFYFLLMLILLSFFRLWKAPEFFSFNFDEEYQAHLAWEQVKNFHPIWIGVSASNLKYYLGPGFTYLNAFLFKLSSGDPIILAYFAPFLGVVTMLSIFYIVKDMFSRRAAVISTIIYGGSALLNFFDRRFWNPLPMGVISVWLIYSMINGQKDSRWFILTSLLMATAFHVHLALMVFWPVVIFMLVLNIKKIKLQTWLAIVVIYFIITSPLLIFDLVHNFDNLKAPFNFLIEKDEPNRTINLTNINSHLNVFLSLLGRIWFLKPGTNIQDEHNLGAHGAMTSGYPVMIFLSLVILGYLTYKSLTNTSPKYRVIFSSIFMFVLSFSLYPGYSAEYYLLGFMALFTIAAGIFFEKSPNAPLYLFLGFFLVFNFYTILTSTQKQYGLATRKELISELMKTVGDQPFALETYGRDRRQYHPYGGWRYLFRIYGKSPTQSFADPHFGWIYKDEISNQTPKLRVIISEDIPYTITIQPLTQTKIGAYYGYIIPYEEK